MNERMQNAPLGKILLDEKLLYAEQLEAALTQQQSCKSRLGEILVSGGALCWLRLSRALAKSHNLPYVNLLEEKIDTHQYEISHLHEYISLRVLPYKKIDNVIWLATSEPGPLLKRWATEYYGKGNFEIAYTSPRDIRQTIEAHFDRQLTEQSRLTLYNSAPYYSARKTFFSSQKRFMVVLLLLAATALYFSAGATLLVFTAGLHIIYAATMLFKLLIFGIGRMQHKPVRIWNSQLPDDDLLPIYTILVPVYREAATIPHLFAALRKLDYPVAKLDIKLILEADDDETYQAALKQKPSRNVEFIRVPPSEPRTKPKACNYALRFARGEIVTIYDAEDAPEPLQLKKAVQAFWELPKEVICLQSHLNYYNAADNWLTRFFSLEYGILFGALLPGLQALSIPLPLGGNSNHFHLGRLREVGEWDPFNVTEDADLGIRIARMGYKTAMLSSLTLEEATPRLGGWMRQRSRWIKGYMQTWLVHMRRPLALYKSIGLIGFLGMQFFIGLSCITFLTAPIVWTLSIAAWVAPSSLAALAFPQWLMPLMMFNLILHTLAHWAQAWVILPTLPDYDEKRLRYMLSSILFPLYWLLHSLASYKALWQLFFRPHFWEKTVHGLSTHMVEAAKIGENPMDSAIFTVDRS